MMRCELKKENGAVMICIDGKNYVPVSFKSFRPTKRNISDFYQAGIRLFNILTSGVISAAGIPYSLYGESWLEDEVYDFTAIDRQIDLFAENAPDAYFSLMIQLDTRPWWQEKREGYPDSFRKMAQMEADPCWRELAANYMQAVIRHVEEKYENRFYGYFLLCGTTTEWFSEDSLEEPTPLVEESFRQWCGCKDICVPPTEIRETEAGRVFLDGQKETDLIAYRRFESWQRADTVLYFAAKAQEVIQHRRLLGVYFGYIFELGGSRLWNTGHLDYERVFLSDDIDMISSPVSYEYRAQDCGSHQMITSATLSAHNKLYFIEHDQTTCLVPDMIEGVYFAHPNKAKNLEEDINLLRRDFMMAMAGGCAMWWFDMFEGWFYHERLMDEIRNMISISEKLFAAGCHSVSEIAVIADPESMYEVNKNASLNDILFSHQRKELSYIGAPYDIFSSCDVDRIDLNRYRFFLFLDQFRKNEKTDVFVKKLKKQGKTMLFLYAYHIIDGGYDVSAMSRELGFPVTENPVPEDSICMEDGVGAKACKKVSCFAMEEGVRVWGRYQNSGKAAFGYQKQGSAIVAFSGLGSMTAEALRKLLNLAGVHQYEKNGDAVVYVNSVMLGIYHRNPTDTVIDLKEDGSYVDLFDGKKTYSSVNGMLTVPYDGRRAKLLVKK